MWRRTGLISIGFLLALAVASTASAQSAITGVVSDDSGAIMPGVTVEVASPALIEQTRTAVTDAAGAYRITDLRPGTYKVTFTLPGFNTLVREGLDLPSEFVATVNAQMKVGGLEETITVSGASPVVDVASTMQRTVLSREQIESLPTGRSFQSLAATVPALAPAGSGRFDVGGASQMWQGTVVAYGSLQGDTALEVDGMSVMTLLNSGSIAGVYHNQGAYQEMSYQVVAGSAESQTGGVRINMIPKEGGNRFGFDFLAMYSNENFRSSNIDDDLKNRGLQSAGNLKEIWDYNGGFGGPIMRDRLWFYHSTRKWGTSNYIANQTFPDGSQAVGRVEAQWVHDAADRPDQPEEQADGDVRRAAEVPAVLHERGWHACAVRIGLPGSVRLRLPGEMVVADHQQAARRSRASRRTSSATTSRTSPRRHSARSRRATSPSRPRRRSMLPPPPSTTPS